MRELDLFSLEKRRFRVDLFAAFQCTKGASKKDREWLVTRACIVRTRRNSFTQQERRFRLGIRRKLFMMRMVRVLREVVDTPSLAVIKAMLMGL